MLMLIMLILIINIVLLMLITKIHMHACMHAGKITYHPLSGDLITCKTDLIQTCMNNY